MTNETKLDRYCLYLAVKFEVTHFFNDHGFTLPELWAIVNGKNINYNAYFWKEVCMIDWMEYDFS